jgi:hypothetical protein
MLLDFPLIQLFRSIISKLFWQGFFELIIVELTMWRWYQCACNVSSSLRKIHSSYLFNDFIQMN